MKDRVNDDEKSMASGIITAEPVESIENIIIQFLENEKSLVEQIHALFDAQLSLFDIGKSPDLKLIHETICFMEDYPELINHPIKLDIIHTIAHFTSEENAQMDELLAEKSLLETQRGLVKHHIDGLFVESTIIKKEQFRILYKDYLEVFEHHIETESTLLPMSIKTALSATDRSVLRDKIADIDIENIHVNDSKYPDLFGQITADMKTIDTKASELAINDAFSIDNMMQHIELLSEGTTQISHIIKEFIYKLYLENYQCYRELLLHSQKRKFDYINKPLLCFRICYNDYLNKLDKITCILKDRKNGTVTEKNKR